MSFESWSDEPIGKVELRDVQAEYCGGETNLASSAKPVSQLHVDVRPLPAWGIYARNVKNLSVEDVRVTVATNDVRPVLSADHMDRVELYGFKFTHVPGVTETIITNNVTTFVQEP